MTKQEKIQEEWNKIGVEQLEPVEGDSFGWRANHNAKYDTWDGRFEVNNFFHRPKSLQGIENNNGWIKIESENDLPKIDSVWIYNENTDDIYKGFLFNPFGYFVMKTATHYQPITKPQPPLY